MKHSDTIYFSDDYAIDKRKLKVADISSDLASDSESTDARRTQKKNSVAQIVLMMTMRSFSHLNFIR